MTSLLKNLGARLSPSGSSGSFRFFRRSGVETSTIDQHYAGPRDGFVMKDLPPIPRGVHQMRTARAFFWGSKIRPATTIDDEETTFAKWGSQFQKV